MSHEPVEISRRTVCGWAALSVAGLALPRAASGAPRGGPAAGSAGKGFENPLFAGDYADPSILRVGRDFYITHTSYKYAPGLVVWHSRDLVNWTHVSSALPRTYGEVWAPDLVEHAGRYYIYFPLDARLFVVHADSPHGPWSEPRDLGVGGIDPGHVVGPDGKRYVHFAGGQAAPLSDDGLAIVGKTEKVYEGWPYPKEWKTEGFWLESPKPLRRGHYYYLVSAEGGTAGPPTSHMAVVARSKSPLGPWENSPHNPLIHTYSDDEAWWSVGHGTLVSTPDDCGYFVYHGYRNGLQTLGRHTLMEPVEWSADGWPVAPLGARRGEPMPAPMGAAQRPMIPLSDSFRSPTLRPTWGVYDERDMGRFRPGDGALRVRAKGDAPGASSPLTVMARDAGYRVEVAVSAERGARAALGLFYSPKHHLFAEIEDGGLRVADAERTLAQVAWKGAAAHLRIVNRRNRVEFLASRDGRRWRSLVADLDTSGYVQNAMGGFQALRPALAACGAGEARFTAFRYASLRD